jgi:hypothetical protein
MLLDSTSLSEDEVVERIEALVQERLRSLNHSAK